MESQIDKGIRKLREQGTTIVRRIQDGKTWWEINGKTLASRKEVRDLANGVYSPSELIERHTKRRAEELSTE